MIPPYIAIRFKHPLTTLVVTNARVKLIGKGGQKGRNAALLAFLLLVHYNLGFNGGLADKLLGSLILH